MLIRILSVLVNTLVNFLVRANVFVQLSVGALLVGVIDLTFALRIRAGSTMQPGWLNYAIPIAVTALWGAVAVFALWRTWRQSQQIA